MVVHSYIWSTVLDVHRLVFPGCWYSVPTQGREDRELRARLFDSVTRLPGVMTDWSALPDVDVFRLPIPWLEPSIPGSVDLALFSPSLTTVFSLCHRLIWMPSLLTHTRTRCVPHFILPLIGSLVLWDSVTVISFRSVAACHKSGKSKR